MARNVALARRLGRRQQHDCAVLDEKIRLHGRAVEGSGFRGRHLSKGSQRAALEEVHDPLASCRWNKARRTHRRRQNGLHTALCRRAEELVSKIPSQNPAVLFRWNMQDA